MCLNQYFFFPNSNQKFKKININEEKIQKKIDFLFYLQKKMVYNLY